ncbi:hypothetical protein MPTK2_8g04810 [Marchantia polymorpha subsp. ruderalis]
METNRIRSRFKRLKLQHGSALDLVGDPMLIDFKDESSIDSLPWDLFMNILGRLHWVDYLRCKLVSDWWNCILKNPLLSSPNSVAISSCEADGPCLVVTDGNDIFVRRASSTWRLPISGIQQWKQLPLTSPSSHPTSAQWKLIATTNGLFLMSAGQNKRKYLLCNPVTRRVEELPRPSKLLVSAELQMSGTYVSRSVEMVTPMGTGGTESRSWPKVIAFERYSGGRGSDTLNMWRFLKYDDESSAWQVVSKLYNFSIRVQKVTTTVRLVPADFAVYYHVREETQDVELEEKEVKLRNCATVGGEIFILLTSVKGPRRTPFAQNTESIEEWFSSVLFKLRPCNLVEIPLNGLDRSPYLQLFQHGGILYIARGMAARDLKVDILRQNSEGTLWDEVTTMPDRLVEELYSLIQPVALFRLQVEGDYVCFSSGYSFGSFGVIIAFHVPTKIWARLDDFTARLREFYSHSRFGPWYPHGQESDDSLQHFFWQPRLDSNF